METEKSKYSRPPFDELKHLIELTDYEVISVEAEREKGHGLRFSGVITLKIAPKELLENPQGHIILPGFISFPQIPQDLISSLQEYAAQLTRQEGDKNER